MKAAALISRAFLVAAPLVALAFANTAALRVHWDLDNLGTSRRYWEDMTVAVSLYETRDWGPTQEISIDDALAARVRGRLRALLPRAAQRNDLRPWEFWRTVPLRSFSNVAPTELRFSDDAGRARLSSLGFRWLGGIAPYLPLWLPFLAFIPLAFWIMVESLRCGEGTAGAIFLGLIASSAYFLEALTLPYSAAGFHLLSALTIVPLSLFTFGPTPTTRGLWPRAVLAAISLHVATWCRSSSIIFLPPAAVLLLIALFRIEAKSSPKRRAILAAILLMVLVAPKAVAPRQAHEFWVGMWEGLGDFDREHGHVWSDWDARIALDTEGYSMERRGPYWTAETEAVFRRLVLHDLRTDPFWYAKILVHRVFATITQWRLWPTARESGLTYQAPQHPAEGFTDTYYNFVKTADVFTAFGRTGEAPLWLLWAGPVLFLAVALRTRAAGFSRRAAVIGSFAAAALLMPVAVTTASGIETQVFTFTFLICGAFVGSDALGKLFRRQELVP